MCIINSSWQDSADWQVCSAIFYGSLPSAASKQKSSSSMPSGLMQACMLVCCRLRLVSMWRQAHRLQQRLPCSQSFGPVEPLCMSCIVVHQLHKGTIALQEPCKWPGLFIRMQAGLDMCIGRYRQDWQPSVSGMLDEHMMRCNGGVAQLFLLWTWKVVQPFLSHWL